MQTKTALIAGATGLVGGELLKVLLERPEYTGVTILVRNSLGINHPKLREVLVEYENLGQYADYFDVDDVFCCLGTTIKTAGSQEAFRTVDFTYPLELAKLAKEKGAARFLIITAMGSDAASRIFYNRIKGEVEAAIKAVGLPSLHIFRPSLLLGDRKEFRLGESVAAFFSKFLSFVLDGPLRKYKPIHARAVASAMFRAAQTEDTGVQIYESDKIAEMK